MTGNWPSGPKFIIPQLPFHLQFHIPPLRLIYLKASRVSSQNSKHPIQTYAKIRENKYVKQKQATQVPQTPVKLGRYTLQRRERYQQRYNRIYKGNGAD